MSRVEHADPNRDMPKTLVPEPMRTKERMDKELPQAVKSSTLTHDPNLVVPNTDI